VQVYQATQEAIVRAKQGDGPSFIECMTYRMLEHCGPNNDFGLGFRSEQDAVSWKQKDPIQHLEKQVSVDLQEQLRNTYQIEIDLAMDEARKAPFPTQLLPERLQCP